MKSHVVIDTNVFLVADKRSPQADLECMLACVRRLRAVRESELVLLDDLGLILSEYRRYLSYEENSPIFVGNMLMRLIADNRGNPDFCPSIHINPSDYSFAEFPDDPALEGFDPSDHKFIAVAVASQANPPILQAVDSKWWTHKIGLKQHVTIEFICPDLIRSLAEAKEHPDA